ncbi:hypothetical protein TKK_0002210 [Trichogramma kaykai]|uniref:Small ribosomal subunit protein uS15m n=1 Tax=Trichogramma kaykai TaxID=54128 RepID=A0ABD2XBP3_9HYME
MNVFRSKLKNSANLVGSIIQGTRGYSTAKKLPIEWIRPVKIPCIDPRKSGDGGVDFNVKPTDFVGKYVYSQELKQETDENVKKIFTVEFNRRKEMITLEKQKATQLLQRHLYDTNSMETKIGRITVHILRLQEIQNINPNDKRTKSILKEMIEKRKKWLRKLRMHDYPRFEYILKNLNLTYKPFSQFNPYINRKPYTTHMLENYCDNMIQQKLEEYKNELDEQKGEFFKDKVEKLQFIRNEEIACGKEPTITEEMIEEAQKQAASIKK